MKFDEVSYSYTGCRSSSSQTIVLISTLEGKPVVKNLSFGIYMDSRIALVGMNIDFCCCFCQAGFEGANGTGKSTIMKLMSGELQPDSGAVAGCSHLRVVK